MSSSLDANAAGLAFLSMSNPCLKQNKELNDRKEAWKNSHAYFSLKGIAKDQGLNATCIRCDKTVVLGTRCCGQYAMSKK